MNNPVSSDADGVPLEEAQEGVLLGVSRYCPDGYVWRDDLIPLGGHDYKGPWLLAASARSVDYAPLRRRAVLSDFARLAEQTTQDAIAKFAARYGLLGVKQPAAAPPEGKLVFGEPLAAWLRELIGMSHLSETWSAIEVLQHEHEHSHAKVNVSLRLLRERLRATADGEVIYHETRRVSPLAIEVLKPPRTPCMLGCDVEDDTEHIWQRVPASQVSLSPGASASDALTISELIVCGRDALAHLISKRLREHVNTLLISDGQSAMIRHTPDSLCTALYLQLALRIAGTTLPERPCEHCPLPFYPTRRDQRFCSKQCRELAGYHRRKDALSLAAF